MTPSLSRVLETYQKVFCTCKCGQLFRLSDAQIVPRGRTTPRDWLGSLEGRFSRLQGTLERAQDRYAERADKVRETQRRVAERTTKDMLLSALPQLKLSSFNTRDIKAIFRPIRFVAFHGLSNKLIERIELLDPYPTSRVQERIQQSIERSINAGNYSWSTIRISDEGKVTRSKEVSPPIEDTKANGTPPARNRRAFKNPFLE